MLICFFVFLFSNVGGPGALEEARLSARRRSGLKNNSYTKKFWTMLLMAFFWGGGTGVENARH